MEVTSSDALSVVLQHPAVATDQRIICRLVQVCGAWRTAVQQSNAGLTDIHCTLWLPCNAEDAEQTTDFAIEVTQFAQWVSRYAGTVRSIFIDIPSVTDNCPAIRNLITLACSVLALGLRLTVQPASVPAYSGYCRTSTAAADNAVAEVVSRQLQLQELTCSSILASPLLLSALPAARLTKLTLKAPDPADSLYEIEQLREATGDTHSLNLTSVGPVSIDLVHLTALQHLHVEVSEGLAALTLPKQLRTLELTYCEDADMALSFASQHLQLQQLVMKNAAITAEDVLSLERLQQLTKIDLAYTEMDSAAAAAPAWPQLAQQLVSLELVDECDRLWCSSDEMSHTLQALSCLTGLTRLELSCELYVVEEEPPEELEDVEGLARIAGICQTLKQLTNLQDLRLDLAAWLDLQQGDILHFSALSNLTLLRLHLSEERRRALDSSSVIAVLQQLSRLQHLDLWRLGDAQALPAIGNLQQLTCLGLPGLSLHTQQQGLRCLTGLKNLCELGGFKDCDEVMLKRFWADLRS